MGTLEGKVALVTGTTSGMGREVALRLAKEGATVVGIARRADRQQVLADEIAANGSEGNYIPFVGDITKGEDIDRVIAQTIEEQGPINILVNAAGLNDDMYAIGNLVDDEWFDYVMNINLIAPMKLMRAVIPGMVDEMEGVIINIASVGGIRGCRAGAAYTAAKHGLIGATTNTAFMYANDDIRCNAICPGPYSTECVPTENMDQFGFERATSSTPSIPRVGEPVNIANLVNFLVSNEAIDINGAVIASDAGWTAQ